MNAATSGVLIRGEGVAASCCAHLLAKAVVPFAVQASDRPKVPAIMIGEAAQKLLADVFDRPDLFSGLPRITKRVVAWGRNFKPVTVPHSAVVVSEAALLDRIQSGVSTGVAKPIHESAWTIFASRPSPAPWEEQHFGSRFAAASRAKLKPACDAHACWIESLDAGWLFLLPGDGCAWLLGVGARTEELLAQSRLVAEQIAETASSPGSFPAHPRIADPLCDSGWLACGTAALGFDPLCGDGAGNAAREAILASAVVRAAIEGADVDALVSHYRARLTAGFKRHLEACRQFYQAGGAGPWWQQELNSLDRGLEWCNRRIETSGGFRFRLSGFALEALE